jgi:hypothetical protein
MIEALHPYNYNTESVSFVTLNLRKSAQSVDGILRNNPRLESLLAAKILTKLRNGVEI